MTSKIELKSEIAEFRNSEEQLKQKVVSFVQDKSISLEERWELFVDSDLGGLAPWISTYGPFDANDNVNEFYFSKHQVVDMVDLVGMLIENRDADCGVLRTLDEINEIKEAMLQKFEKGFIFDW